MKCNAFDAALFDELEPIFPDTKTTDGTNLHIVAAASETFAGVHIMLNGVTAGNFVTVELIAPPRKITTEKDDKTIIETLPDTRFKLFELLPLPVEVNTGAKSRTEWTGSDINKDVIRRAPFMVYDVLKPCTNVIKATGEVMALAFRCKVQSAIHEMQKWDLIISCDGVSKRLTFEVEVFPISVPAASKDDHKYVNWFSHSSIADYHNAPMFSDAWYDIYEQYLTLAKYGRQNMASVSLDLFFDYTKGEFPKLNKTKLDRLIAIYDKVGMYWIEGGHFASRKDNDWDATLAQINFSEKVFPGEEAQEELSDMGKQLYDYLVENKLTERWIQSFMDEPIDCLADTFKKGVELMKKAMPGILFLEATIAKESITDTVDYWCPTVDEYENNKEFFDERVKNHKEHIFVYTCLTPVGNYCNRLLDMERVRPVYIGWAPALYENVEGFLHWGGMSMGNFDPYYHSVPLTAITDYDTSRKPCLPAGDPMIMFPGFHEVYSSTRLEAHRIGFEDLYLLEQLKKKNPQKAAEIVAMVFRRYNEYEKDVCIYRKARRMLLEEAQKVAE